MKFSTKKLGFLALIAAVAVTGCSKKPKRPDPSSTVMGPSGLSATDLNLGAGSGGLTGDNVLDPRAGGTSADGDRTALAAQTVYFDFNQSALKGSERPKLEAAQKYLNDNPEARLLLEGHCDWRGTPEYNLGLGDRRAAAAKEYLVSLGVPDTRLEVLSKGDLDAVENADEATLAHDRRVELVVLKQ